MIPCWRSPVCCTLVAFILMSVAGCNRAKGEPLEDRPEHPAYLELVQADAARDAQLWGEALRRYEAAADKFTALSREHPEVMPRAVEWRIAYCRNEISTIRNRLASRAADAYVDAVREIEALRKRIKELETLVDPSDPQESETLTEKKAPEQPESELP